MYDPLSKHIAKTFLVTILLTILLSTAFEAKGKPVNKNSYTIRVEFKDNSHKSYFKNNNKVLLYKALWGIDQPMDSAIISNKGISELKGKNLGTGEFTLKVGNKTIAELFVSDTNISQKESLAVTLSANGKEIHVTHKKGSVENNLFITLQNIILSVLKSGAAPQKIAQTIDSICTEISKKTSGTLLDNMCKLSLNANSEKPSYIRENYPFNDNRLIHTRFGKSIISGYLDKTRINTNEAIELIADDIIAAASDSMKPYIASEVYHKFEESDIMGQEDVSIYIAKKYFAEGGLKWPNEDDEFLANAFVHMNENSLIGMKAPAISMKDTSGNTVSIDSIGGKFKIIYFYSADCKTCKIETPRLVNFLKEYSGAPVSVYAVFTDGTKDKWIKYIAENFNCKNPSVKWYDVWDPDIESNFPLLYGVISTPQLYLINEGIIKGRRLRSDSLKELLEIENKTK